jgi:hypothetical protein
MKRRQPHARGRSSRDAERLAWLARGLAESGSRVEDAFWEREIAALVDRLLENGNDDALNQALEQLYQATTRGYDELADLIESGVEGRAVASGEAPGQVLLIAMPVLAWSSYGIPAPALPAQALAALKAQIGAHVLAAEVRLALADHLFSPDQLPQGYVASRRLAESLWQAALDGRDEHIDGRHLPVTGQYISDVRYLLGAVWVPSGRPVFRWNEADARREDALAQWQAQAIPSLQPLLPGCSLELLQPDAYFAAWRRADREGRPFSLRASAAYLQGMLDVPGKQLRAVVAPYYEQHLAEWRVGFAGADSPSSEVMHGVVWPLFGPEDEGMEVGDEIVRIIESAGVGQVTLINQGLPVEYCDDCGAPLFPNADGESVHAEMPEPDNSTPAHLH